MNENDYAAQWAAYSSTRRLLKQARLVIGRTTKQPPTLRTDGIFYKTLPCPSILCDYHRPEEREGDLRIAYSIQLPTGTPGGVVNHTTSHDAHSVALQSLRDTIKVREVDLICHHKSEFIFWRSFFKDEPRVRVLQSSWFQDVWQYYRACDAVVSTRLHAVLWMRAMGKPGIVVNNSERHQAALEHFPGTKFTLRGLEIAQFVGNLNGADMDKFAEEVTQHRHRVFEQYMEEIKPHVAHFTVSQ
jgi:hypothetical protein